MNTINVLQNSGLRDKGFRMIALGGGWMLYDDENLWIPRNNYLTRPNNNNGPQKYPALTGNGVPGCLIPDPVKFPQGVRAFRDLLKSKGFNFGMYTSGQITSCVSGL